MSSPQPQKLLVAPTPRVTLADPADDMPRGRIGFQGGSPTAATTPGVGSSAAQPQLRYGRHDAAETLAYYTAKGSGNGETAPAASGGATKVRRGSHSPSITDHHIWTIGTSKRRTKSALRSSAALSRQQLELHHEVYAGTGGGIPGPGPGAANSSVGLSTSTGGLAAGGATSVAVPVVDQAIHYGVAGYRSENSGSVSFYRTSVHRKDPQNVVLSHGMVVHPRAFADSSWSSPGVPSRNVVGFGTSGAVATSASSHQYQHRRTSSASLLESDSSSQAVPQFHNTGTPVAAPALRVIRHTGHGDEQTSLDGADRPASVAQLVPSHHEEFLLHSDGGGARTASPPRPRWNTSARVAAAGGTSPPPTGASGPGGAGRSSPGTSKSPPLLSRGPAERGGSRHPAAAPAGSSSHTPRDSSSNLQQGYGAPTHPMHLRSALVASSSRTPRASSVGSHPPSLSGAGAPPTNYRPPHHSHWSPQHGQHHPLQSQPGPGGAPSVAGPHIHNCRDSHCLHSRADIMEVISAKSQVRAMESQLLHEEIRREQLASALSAERERSQQLSSALSRAEASVHASQEMIHDADALRDRCGRLADELRAVTRERDDVRLELRRESELRQSLSAIVSEHEALIAQLRDTIRSLERQRSSANPQSVASPPAPPLTLQRGGASPPPNHDEYHASRPSSSSGNAVGSTSATVTTMFGGGGPSGPAAAAMRAFTFPPPLEEAVVPASSKRQSPVSVNPPETSTETTKSNSYAPAAATVDASAARLQALEAEVARLKEDRTTDERLRKELLRALADKEKQMASLSSSSSRAGSLRGSIIGVAALAGLASPSSLPDAVYEHVDVSALSAPSPPDRGAASSSRRSSARRILLTEPTAAATASPGGEWSAAATVQRKDPLSANSTVIDSRHSRVLQVAQSMTQGVATGVEAVPRGTTAARELGGAPLLQSESLMPRSLPTQEPPLPSEPVPPLSALRSVEVTISSVNHSIDSEANGSASTTPSQTPRASVEHRLFPPTSGTNSLAGP